MVNGATPKVKLQWIQGYHGAPENPRSGSESGADMRGNCPRCGKALPNHEAQSDHNEKVHLGA